MGFFEVSCRVFAFEHVDLDVLEVQSRDLAVEQQCAAVCVQEEPDQVDFVGLDAWNNAWSSVNLVFAQRVSHN